MLALQSRLRHRGPDWSGMYVCGNNVIAHERLAIVDVDKGAQPLLSGDLCACKHPQRMAMGVNGEIYNHKAVRANLKKPHSFATDSDCEPILHMCEEMSPGEVCNALDGIFAFVLYDPERDTYTAGRDHIGVNPLYYGKSRDGAVWFASEVKAIHQQCNVMLEEFPPGHYITKEGGLQRWYQPVWWDEKYLGSHALDLKLLRDTFTAAVVRMLMCDVPMGVLLSGGLDSSLVAAVVARYLRDMPYMKLHSFSIGLPNSPDLVAAREVARHLGTTHHEYNFTVQDGIDALKNVIYHLETYDVTTIRASTPMYLLSRKIRATGVKMVLSGEGADEILGGYLYFHRAPNADDFHRECVRRVKGLHLFDCLRANKSTQAWGLECRPPFLDKTFLDVAMTLDAAEKLCTKDRIEKWVMRKAFDNPADPYLPSSILWRQKEQFSDGVGYNWIDSLIAHTASRVSDEELAAAPFRFLYNTPTTKEAYFYRCIFTELYPEQFCAQLSMKWIPKWSSSTDPSGRAQGVHSAHTAALKGGKEDESTANALEPPAAKKQKIGDGPVKL